MYILSYIGRQFTRSHPAQSCFGGKVFNNVLTDMGLSKLFFFGQFQKVVSFRQLVHFI